MSQETTTQLLGLPTEYGVPGEDGKAFSAAEVDQRSASRMLRVLMLFAWGMSIRSNDLNQDESHAC